ncbi:MAG TPA: anti-sigma factor [Solirubrobacteraceae bacterium]|jgi:anti-sigma-K factor RskA
MSNRRPTSDTHECGGDAAAYVLGALEPEELGHYLVHLRDCVVCRDEVAALSRVVNALAMSAPEYRAPTELRQRVLDAARERPSATGARAPRARPRVLAVPKLALAVAACAAVIAVAAIAGFGALSGGSQSARVVQASVVGSPGRAALRVSGSHAELVVNDLRQPSPGAVYEVWLTRPGRPPTPAHALFDVTTAGAANVRIPGDLQGVSQVLVTQEPAGGSPKPTHPALIVARLT